MGGRARRAIGLASWAALTALFGCGGAGSDAKSSDATSGGGEGGGGSALATCKKDQPNAAGPVVDMEWPAKVNTGHDALEGQTVRFHWTGKHNVLQVASFDGQPPPTAKLGDAHWKGELRSGDIEDGGTFDWNVGSFPCGYRPGIYFFVDEADPVSVVAISLTVDQAKHYYSPRSVTELDSLYGGRYAKYAGRKGAMIHEVNDFQTEAHFDWVDPTFGATQGDLILFRWTGEHNVVQVHDVTQDSLVPGGIHSGPKSNCVGGPQYSCVNGEPSVGEYLIDTADYHPGMIHLSDECALACTGHTTGMNMEYLLRGSHPAPEEGSCCALPEGKSKGKSCRVIDVFNDADGLQFGFDIPARQGDLVRFRWSGKVQITQTADDAAGNLTKNEKPGGVKMAAPVECTPGPDMSCLEGNTADARFIFDVNQALASGAFESDQYDNKWFDFFATGENTDGFSSADSGVRVYLDTSVAYDPNPPACQ